MKWVFTEYFQQFSEMLARWKSHLIINNMTLVQAVCRCTNPTSDTLNLKWRAMYLLLRPSQWYYASLRFLDPKSFPVWWHLNQDQYGRSSPGLWFDQWKTLTADKKRRRRRWEKEAVTEKKERESIVIHEFQMWSNLIEVFFKELNKDFWVDFGCTE